MSSIYNNINSSEWYCSLKKEATPSFDKNIHALCRGISKNEYFVVKKGELVIRKRQTCLEKIIYFFTHLRHQFSVKKVISETVKRLTSQVHLISQVDLQSLFFQKMAKLSEKVFDRSSIHKKFTYLLNPELDRIKKTEDNKNDKNLSLDRRIEKVKLALKLGVDLIPISRGNCGSYYARDYRKKIIGVFKPGIEESLGSSTPKLIARINYFVLKHIFKIDTAASFWKKEGYLAEVMTSELSQHMGFKIVPISKVVSIESTSFYRAKKEKKAVIERGSFQRYIKDSKSCDEELKLKSKTPLFGGLCLKINLHRQKNRIKRVIDQKQFEQMAFTDFINCNRDRHFENLLLKHRKGSEKFDLKLIDHQLSFPAQNPPQKDFLYRRNQYKWAVFPQAQHSFSEELKVKALTMLKGENLRHLIDKLSSVNDPYGRGFSTRKYPVGSSQLLAMKQRIAVLLLAMERNMSLKELASIKSQEAINSFLSKEKGSQFLDESSIDRFLNINI